MPNPMLARQSYVRGLEAQISNVQLKLRDCSQERDALQQRNEQLEENQKLNSEIKQ